MKLVDIPENLVVPARLIRALPKRKCGRILDITGWTLGELKVIGYIGKIRETYPSSRFARLYWLCQCNCKRYRIIRSCDAKIVKRCRHCTLTIKHSTKTGTKLRTSRINIKLLKEEKEKIEKRANSAGLSVQEFCISILLKGDENE